MIGIKVTGANEARAALDPLRVGAGVRSGLIQGAGLIERTAKGVVATHHWHGTAERSIHQRVSGSGINSEVMIGSNTGRAPHFRSLAYGWPGGKGKQPPTDAIAKWLTSKPEIVGSFTQNVKRNSAGFVSRRGSVSSISKERAVRGLAFVIARKIGKSGFSFDPLEPFEKAWDMHRRQVTEIVAKAITEAMSRG